MLQQILPNVIFSYDEHDLHKVMNWNADSVSMKATLYTLLLITEQNTESHKSILAIRMPVR